MGLLNFCKTNEKPQNHIALCIYEDGIAVAMMGDGIGQLGCVDFLACEISDRWQVLAAYLAAKSIKSAYCKLVLSLADYRMFCLDVPDVPQEEWRAASRWLIKDLIDKPLAELAVDVFPIPHPSGQPNKLYVVAAEIAYLKALCAELQSINVVVESINIYELPFAGVMATTLQIHNPIAVVYHDQSTVWVGMFLNGQVILVRQLGVTAALTDASQYESLGLELQRSMDYFQTQMRQSSIVKCIVQLDHCDGRALVASFNQQLAVPAEYYDAASYFSDFSCDDIHRCLAVMGEIQCMSAASEECGDATAD